MTDEDEQPGKVHRVTFEARMEPSGNLKTSVHKKLGATLRATGQLTTEHSHIELDINWRLAVLVLVIVFVPPLLPFWIAALGGFLGVCLGWALGAISFVVGYFFLTRRVTKTITRC